MPRGRKPSGTVEIDSTTPWQEDYFARAWVVHHPDGSTLEEVGALLGVTRERVRQIQDKATRRLRVTCRSLGYDLQDIIAHMASRHDEAADAIVHAPLGVGPSEATRAARQAAADRKTAAEEQEPEEDEEESHHHYRLPEEFYDERNARAVALFDELDLERRADAALRKISGDEP